MKAESLDARKQTECLGINYPFQKSVVNNYDTQENGLLLFQEK